MLSAQLETRECDSAELLIEDVSANLEPRGNFFAKVFTAVEVVGPSCAVAISCELQIATAGKHYPVFRTR